MYICFVSRQQLLLGLAAFLFAACLLFVRRFIIPLGGSLQRFLPGLLLREVVLVGPRHNIVSIGAVQFIVILNALVRLVCRLLSHLDLQELLYGFLRCQTQHWRPQDAKLIRTDAPVVELHRAVGPRGLDVGLSPAQTTSHQRFMVHNTVVVIQRLHLSLR